MSVKGAILDKAGSLLGSGIGGWRIGLKACDIKVVPLVYHLISDHHVPHVAHLHRYKNRAQFKADIEFLAKNFSILDPADLATLAKGELTLKKPAFLITIDDGLKEIKENIAPALRAKGIPAIFFVNSGFIDNKELFFRHKASLLIEKCLGDGQARERLGKAMQCDGSAGTVSRALLDVSYTQKEKLDAAAEVVGFSFDDFLAENRPYLSVADLQDLAKEGFAIGAHSRSHPHYALLSQEAQQNETSDSVVFVKEALGLDSVFFAFPFHDLDVTASFFEQMAGYGVHASFGTHGFQKDTQPGNWQRIFADRPDIQLEKLIAKKCGEFLLLRMIGKHSIVRRPG